MDPLAQAADRVAADTAYDQVQVVVLKKAENLDADSALALVDAAVATSMQVAAVNPPTLGQNVDVQA
jgi:hypothetical protein